MVRPDADASFEPSAALLDAIDRVTAKRPRTVLDHILRHGYVTTAELKELYGYNHPPRAARDVREHGIPLTTTWVTGSDGRRMAAYRFSSDEVDRTRGGRRAFPKAFKELLLDVYGEACGLCGAKAAPQGLQIDHRVPYEIAGDTGALAPEPFMLVDGSCNRAKSWTCEHCPNWRARDVSVCMTCGWATPERYTHVATIEERRLTLVWQGREVSQYDELAKVARRMQKSPAEQVKIIIRADYDSAHRDT